MYSAFYLIPLVFNMKLLLFLATQEGDNNKTVNKNGI
jgi:hypothetical protein